MGSVSFVFVAGYVLFVARAAAQPRVLGNERRHHCSWNPSGPLSQESNCSLPIDESYVRAADWHPWTHRPVCTGPGSKKGSKYCAFVKDDFRGDSSILILTSPEVAAGDYSLVHDFDPQWVDSGPSSVMAEVAPFETREIPDKGVGVMATSTMRAGEVIMREYPAILQTIEGSEGINYGQALWVLEEGFVRLPVRDQKRVFGLARSTGGHVLEDIIRTNTFGATFNNVSHYGLFPGVARINHDCKPNAITRFSPRTLALEVVAYRDIQPGEELTISYTPLNMPSKERQQTLRDWGFECGCALCRSTSALAISDGRRARMQAILAALDDGRLGTSVSAAEELAREMEEVLGDEGLTAQAGDFYGMFARVLLGMGEVEKGRRYAALAVEKLAHFAGYDDERTEMARGLLGELGKVGGRTGG